MTDATVNAKSSISAWLRPSVVISVSAVVVAGLLGLALIFAIGVSVPDALSAFVDGTVGSPYAIAASINRSIAFALVGIGFVIANRANLVNVGGEGQIAVGGIAATAVALYGHVAGLPAGLPFIIPLLAAAVAGMLWGSIAGILKIKAGTNEVISTLLLSFIAVWLLYWCVQSPALLRKPMTSSATLPESLEIPESTKLPLLTGDYSFPVHIGLPITIIIAIIAAIVLCKTLFGVQLRAVGFNPVAANRAGISYPRMVMLALAIAGALGGLAGGFMLLGDQYVLKDGFSSGYGFDGLVAGLLGARFDRRRHRRGVAVRLSSFRRHQHGNGRRRADRVGDGDPGTYRRHAGGRRIFHRAARMTWELFAVFIGSSLRLAVPLLLAGTGELVSERAGVLNMSIEGMMLTGAFAAAVGAWATGSPMLGSVDRHHRGASGGAAAGIAEQYAARQSDRHRHRHQHSGAGRDHARLSRNFRRALARANSRPGEMEPAAARRHSGLRRGRVPAGVAALCRRRHHRSDRARCCATPRSALPFMPPAPSRARSTNPAYR